VTAFVRPRTLSGGLLLCGLLLALIWHLGFAAPYGLEAFGQRPRQSIGTLTGFSNAGAYLYIGAMAALFVLHGAAVWLAAQADRHLARRARRWLLVWVAIAGLGFSAVLLPMYPVDASDIYDYILRGRLSAVYGLNPLEQTPSAVPTDPFYRFASWRRTPSAYGPAWELIAHVVSAGTAAASRNAQVLAYKLVAVAGYGLTAVLVSLTLRRIAPQRLVSGSLLFLWNPLVVYMTAGRGHNDAVMTAGLAAAIYCLTRRWYLQALLCAVLGALVKFIPALVIPVIVVVALRDLGRWRGLRPVLFGLLLGGLLAALLYLPYWHGWDTLRTTRRSVMYTGSVATVARQFLMPVFDGAADPSTPARDTPVTAALLANGSLALFGLYALAELVHLWRTYAGVDRVAPIRVTARLVLAYLLIASLWFQSWYVIWLIALVAVIENTPVRRLVLMFAYLVTWQSLLYNYFAIQPRGSDRLPWLDLVPVAIYMGYAWAFIAVFQARLWLRRSTIDEHDRAIGAHLRADRLRAGRTLGELSDAVGLPYEGLVQYESGLRALPLDHARALAHTLGASFERWLGIKA
jgi:hypothetical protein